MRAVSEELRKSARGVRRGAAHKRCAHHGDSARHHTPSLTETSLSACRPHPQECKSTPRVTFPHAGPGGRSRRSVTMPAVDFCRLRSQLCRPTRSIDRRSIAAAGASALPRADAPRREPRSVLRLRSRRRRCRFPPTCPFGDTSTRCHWLGASRREPQPPSRRRRPLAVRQASVGAYAARVTVAERSRRRRSRDPVALRVSVARSQGYCRALVQASFLDFARASNPRRGEPFARPKQLHVLRAAAAQ